MHVVKGLPKTWSVQKRGHAQQQWAVSVCDMMEASIEERLAAVKLKRELLRGILWICAGIPAC